jgi:hypothetical protein
VLGFSAEFVDGRILPGVAISFLIGNLLRDGKRMRFRFIQAEKASYPVRLMCRVLKVSTSGYYAYLEREPSTRQREDERLKVHIGAIGAIHARCRGTYGRARVGQQLLREDVELGKQRVARLMREMGLQGLPRTRFRRDDRSDSTVFGSSSFHG